MPFIKSLNSCIPQPASATIAESAFLRGNATDDFAMSAHKH